MPSDRTAGTPDPAVMPRLDEAFGPDPYPMYAELRKAGPVHQVIGPEGRPIWLVTGFQDARAALADPRLSLNRSNATPGSYTGLSLPPALDKNLLNMDGRDHARLRRLVAPAFGPARMEGLRQQVRDTAAGLLDSLGLQPGPVDLVEDYAAPLSLVLLCDILGVDQTESERFRRWTTILLNPSAESRARLGEALEGIVTSLTVQIQARRAEPGTDLLSVLIAAHDGEDRLSADELLSLAFLLLFAGYENTIAAIATAVATALTEPGLRSRLRESPDAVTEFVEETIRFDGPVELAIRRFATEDVEISGVVIPAGDPVLVALASAHRDPAAFTCPNRMTPGRTEQGHLGFGHGPHYCLGAALARLEIVTAVTVLLERYPAATLTTPREELRPRPSVRTRGIARLPVLLRPEDD
ncbi:cytochrome P450 family protein [Streptacidiphilus albus]|uniref:cytochrome P450 family protein n=1 Tax=Streptacidiphilus albus TaxID=105425 RepID=UPI000AC14C2F|nr:cytochrome P450 [Streptacidiphilus albus]